MQKIALIDIGTNSVRMIILKENDNDSLYSNKYMDTTRIGEGVDKTKNISDDGMNRTIEALKKYKKIADDKNVSKIYAIATSAVRDSENKSIFLQKVKEEVGLEISVISGEEEARLGFLGVSKGVEISKIVKSDDYILVIDIGGGSTELIVGRNGNIEYSISLDLGAVRMTDKFVSSDPVLKSEQDKMSNYIVNEINTVMDNIIKYPIKTIIGIGGTITTAGTIDFEMEEYDRKKIHNHYISLKNINAINSKLWKKTIDERKNTKGLQPKRADIIPAGFMILELLLLSIKSSGIVISEYDNLEGMFFDKKA